MNFYKILNVNINANEKDIKKAYRVLAKKFHPDTYNGDKSFAEKKMQEINLAYDTLSNADLRKKYDEKIGVNIERENKTQSTSNTTYYKKQSQNIYENRYNKSGVNYNVRYKPNNRKIEYDSNGYAESNYYTSEAEKEWKSGISIKDIKEKLTKKNVAVILLLLGVAIVLCSMAINQAIKNMSEFFGSTQGVYNKINSAKKENQQKHQEIDLKEDLFPIIENTVNSAKTEGKELINKFENYQKESNSKSKKQVLNDWGITNEEDQKAILEYIEQFN